MRFHSAVFQNERWLSGLFRGKSQATKKQSGIVWSPFQVYKIILIPHKQQAEIDSDLPLSRNEWRAVSWKYVPYSMVRPNSSRIVDLGIFINFQIYHFLREKSPFFCDGREWSFLLKTIISLNSKVMSLYLWDRRDLLNGCSVSSRRITYRSTWDPPNTPGWGFLAKRAFLESIV
jgi:hypothetical protein